MSSWTKDMSKMDYVFDEWATNVQRIVKGQTEQYITVQTIYLPRGKQDPIKVNAYADRGTKGIGYFLSVSVDDIQKDDAEMFRYRLVQEAYNRMLWKLKDSWRGSVSFDSNKTPMMNLSSNEWIIYSTFMEPVKVNKDKTKNQIEFGVSLVPVCKNCKKEVNPILNFFGLPSWLGVQASNKGMLVDDYYFS